MNISTVGIIKPMAIATRIIFGFCGETGIELPDGGLMIREL